jgi:hypothetical protein
MPTAAWSRLTAKQNPPHLATSWLALYSSFHGLWPSLTRSCRKRRRPLSKLSALNTRKKRFAHARITRRPTRRVHDRPLRAVPLRLRILRRGGRCLSLEGASHLAWLHAWVLFSLLTCLQALGSCEAHIGISRCLPTKPSASHGPGFSFHCSTRVRSPTIDLTSNLSRHAARMQILRACCCMYICVGHGYAINEAGALASWTWDRHPARRRSGAAASDDNATTTLALKRAWLLTMHDGVLCCCQLQNATKATAQCPQLLRM